MTMPVSGDRSLGNLYFRSADRLRAAGCATSLAREGLSVVMQCEREALLDHYCDMVLAELTKSHGDVRVEAYFPESTESLMARFNEILAPHSVQDALKPGVADAPLRVWVVHDAARVPGAEIQLLARLIHNFPGANVRALLLVPQADAEAACSSAFAAFGRRLLRWDIDLPSPAQIDAALESARYEDREMAVRQLLRLSGLLPSDGAPSPALAAAVATAPTPAETTAAAHVAAKQATGGSRILRMRDFARNMSRRLGSHLGAHGVTRSGLLTGARPTSRFLWRKPSEKVQGAIAVAGALLAISTLAMYWLQPDAFAGGKAARTTVTPNTEPTAVQAAASGTTPVVGTAPSDSTRTVAQAPASSRFGQGVSPLWRARDASASAKLQ